MVNVSLIFDHRSVWLSGNALVSINVVALRRARLVLGWVTVRGYIISVFNQSHPGLLSLTIPPWVGAMSTGDGLGHRWGRNGEFCVIRLSVKGAGRYGAGHPADVGRMQA